MSPRTKDTETQVAESSADKETKFATSHPNSITPDSSGRGTSTGVALLVVANRLMSRRLFRDVKGTTLQHRLGVLWTQVQNEFDGIAPPAVAKLEAINPNPYELDMNGATLYVALLTERSQCGFCGSTPESSKSFCPECDDTVKWIKKDNFHYTETVKK